MIKSVYSYKRSSGLFTVIGKAVIGTINDIQGQSYHRLYSVFVHATGRQSLTGRNMKK